ncbi:MAG: hypothetical protein M0P31_18815 [Solirubrobacteraceae bacterium]|nr:hypothetical protein [Solirubrobacteraceae bacterium]
MTGPPAKKFSDTSTSRGGDESERQFRYFTPAKRRASLYEDVTCDTQPSVHRHLLRGWPLCFEDGRTTWDDRSTALKSRDWFAFRDPLGLWERPFYQLGARAEAQIDAAVASARRDGLFDDFDPAWVEFLRTNLQIPAFAEHGLWLAMASIGRDCLSDSITHAVVFEAASKQRTAQSIVLYAMDLENHFGSFEIAAAKTRWLEHEAWQPVRELVERLHYVNDWGEVIVATNLLFEPLIGTMIRRELGIRAARVNGDTVTAAIVTPSQAEAAWAADWTIPLVRHVIEDEAHGGHNREVIAGWIDSWLPSCNAAVDALTSIISDLPVGFSSEQARERVSASAAQIREQAGIADLVKAAVA